MSLPFKRRIKDVYLRVKTLVLISAVNMMRSPLRWSWIFWDGYNEHKFPDQLMRIIRVIVGVAGLCKFIAPAWVGMFFFIDGFYSIYRYRFEIPRTNSWYEDLPRGARSLFGYMLMVGFI